MKTLKSLVTGVALLLICVAANATVKHIADKPTKDDVVKIYIDAINNGNTKNLDKVLDESMQFNMQRGENVNTINKDQFINSVKSAGASGQAVTTATTVMQEDDSNLVIKIEFKYDGYTRTDVVTLANTNGWNITNVNCSVK